MKEKSNAVQIGDAIEQNEGCSRKKILFIWWTKDPPPNGVQLLINAE